MNNVVAADGAWLVTLTVNLHRTANPTVSEVSCDVFTPGVSLGAAPGGAEPSRLGAGVVDLACEDEGELAGCGTAGGGGGGGGSRASCGVTVAPRPSHVVTVLVSGGGAPRPLEPSVQGALAVRLTLEYTAM